MKPRFTHLHTHTEYSLLDGLSRIKPIIKRAQEMEMESLAITDHGSLYGVIEFYLACKEAGIKPIIGCETYLAQGTLTSKTPQDKSPYHLTLLAKDNNGYRNLIRLITKAHLDGFYYRPRIDKELLFEHRQGLVALSGCLNAEIPRLIQDGNKGKALNAASWYQEAFGEDFYLELQRHPATPALDEVNTELTNIGRKLGIPLVATNDCHYIYQEDAPLQDILICIHTNTTTSDPKRLKMDDDSYYLKSPEEMEALFQDLPEALINTQAIADKCRVDIDFSSFHLPEFKTPTSEDPDEYLAKLCWEGLGTRIPEAANIYKTRLQYELGVIKKTNFAHYFLVVWDIARYARDQGILFGIRGSAAASLALYCLNVTDIDPLEYRLVFERFLNLERKEMPDIDMDFQDDRRDEVIKYVVHKYGRDHVAQIITFGTLGAKAAIRDVGRALAMPYTAVDNVARLIPSKARTIHDAMEQNPELVQAYEGDPSYHKLIDTAKKLEGVARHASTHAAGVVISKEVLTDYIPLQRPIKEESNETPMTQFSMDHVAKLGLLKMDFLGLTNLTILDQAVKIVGQTLGIKLDLHSMPLDDRKTFDLLSQGETTDVFQLESTGMRRHIKELKPSSLNDIAAMIALYRPGPMEHIDTFVKAKHGHAKVRYPHPALKEILEETYGVIVYQDQVLLIAQAFAGYSLGEADIVRKAMGKKIPEIMQREKERFVQGALKKGFTIEDAQSVFALIEPFAGYAFNKAHSISYALISYWTAYFKANYQEEYLTAVLNTRTGQQDKMAAAVEECRRLGMSVLRPDVNKSSIEFTIEEVKGEERAIRFGLSAIKNVGATAVKPIVEERGKKGPFTSIEDFFRRTALLGINRRALESIIKVGAFDSLGDRGAVLAGIERLLALSQREARLRQSGQSSMFNLFGEAVHPPMIEIDLPQTKATTQEKLTWERELLGIEIFHNPHSRLVYAARRSDAIISKSDLDPDMDGQRITLVGAVTSYRELRTKMGRPFLSVVLRLLGGEVEVTVWQEVLQSSQEVWVEGKFLNVVGRVRVRGEQLSVTCEEAWEYQLPSEGKDNEQTQRNESPNSHSQGQPQVKVANGQKLISIYIEETVDQEKDHQLLNKVLQLLLEYPGSDQVQLNVKSGKRVVRLDIPFITIAYSPDLHHHLVTILGPEAITLHP